MASTWGADNSSDSALNTQWIGCKEKYEQNLSDRHRTILIIICGIIKNLRI